MTNHIFICVLSVITPVLSQVSGIVVQPMSPIVNALDFYDFKTRLLKPVTDHVQTTHPHTWNVVFMSMLYVL